MATNDITLANGAVIPGGSAAADLYLKQTPTVQANTGIVVDPNKAPASEPAVISTASGKDALNGAIGTHQATVSNIQNQNKPVVTDPGDGTGSKASAESVKQFKAMGAMTADDASAAGITSDDLASGYTYDPNTGYFFPKDSTTAAQATTADPNSYEAQKQKIIDGFTNITGGWDATTKSLIDTITKMYDDRMDQQKIVNSHEESAINTENVRNGTSRYAGGVAGGILTTQENAGLKRINEIENEKLQAIVTAQQHLQDNKYKSFMDEQGKLEELRKEQNGIIKDLKDRAVEQAKVAQDKVEKDRQYEFDVKKFNETKDQDAFERGLKTEQENFDENYKTAQLKLERDKLDNTIGPQGVNTGISGSVSMTASNKPDPIQQQDILNQITKTYGAMTATAIKGIASYTMNPADFSTRSAKGGMTRAQAVALAQQLDPTYDDKLYATRSAYLKNISSGQMAQGILSANKAINHLVSFTDSVKKLPNGIFSSVNALDNAVTLNQGVKQTLSTAKTEANGLKDELAKFFKGTGAADVKSIDDWSKNLDVNASPAAQRGLIQGAITLLAGQLDVMNQQYATTMGKAPEGTILQQQTIDKLSALKNQGYTVDIPGVNYTDKSAWIKYGGGSQDSWNSAIDKINAAGLPLTDENILQVTQSDDTPNEVKGYTSPAKQYSTIDIPESSNLAYINKNPGNLRFAGQEGASQGHGGFAKFSSAEDGFKALVDQVKLDASRGMSLVKFISKFAPPSENDTKTYIKQIAASLGISPTAKISEVDANTLAKAIARKESSTNIL